MKNRKPIPEAPPATPRLTRDQLDTLRRCYAAGQGNWPDSDDEARESAFRFYDAAMSGSLALSFVEFSAALDYYGA